MISDINVPLLVIEDLHVSVGDREILRGIDLAISEGETHVLLGPNGSGKSTLLNTIVGLPGYRITRGRVLFKDTDLAGLEIDERARMGIGSPIAAEEIYYLMTRGMPKDEAVSMITRGFVNIDIPGLPDALRRQIDRAIEETAKETM